MCFTYVRMCNGVSVFLVTFTFAILSAAASEQLEEARSNSFPF